MNEIIDNHLSQLNDLKVIKECYELRLHLIKKDYAKKDEYEKNEVDLLRVKTLQTIKKINVELKKAEDEFQESYGRMIEELEFKEKELV